MASAFISKCFGHLALGIPWDLGFGTWGFRSAVGFPRRGRISAPRWDFRTAVGTSTITTKRQQVVEDTETNRARCYDHRASAAGAHTLR